MDSQGFGIRVGGRGVAEAMPPRQRRGALQMPASPLRRRSASMGVAMGMARREEFKKLAKDRPLFAEEHYDAAEIEKRKKKAIAQEVKAARRGAEEAKAIAAAMAEEKLEAEQQLRKREEDMENMARNVGKSARDASNRIRAYEAQNAFLQSEIQKNSEKESELLAHIAQLERKVEEAQDETQWASDNAGVALKEAEEKQEEIRREVTKRIKDARAKENLLELTTRHEALMEGIATSMADSIVQGVQLQLSDMRDVLLAQQREIEDLTRFKAERMAAVPPPAVAPRYVVRTQDVVLGDPKSSTACSSPSSVASPEGEPWLSEGEADFLELPPEDNYYRTLKALPPRYGRVAAALEGVVVGSLAVVAASVLYMQLVREGWTIVPDNLCLRLRMGGRDELTTVRLVDRRHNTATYEADVAVSPTCFSQRSPSYRGSPLSRSTTPASAWGK